MGRRARRSRQKAADGPDTSAAHELLEHEAGKAFQAGSSSDNRSSGHLMTAKDVVEVRQAMQALVAGRDRVQLLAVLMALRSFATEDWKESQHGSPLADEHVIATLLDGAQADSEGKQPEEPVDDAAQLIGQLLLLGEQAVTRGFLVEGGHQLDAAAPAAALAARYRDYHSNIRGQAYEEAELALCGDLFELPDVREALRAELGFDGHQAIACEQAITWLLERRAQTVLVGAWTKRPDLATRMAVTEATVARSAQLGPTVAGAYLKHFSVPLGHREASGALLKVENLIRMRPLIDLGEGRFLPTSPTNLLAALRPTLEQALKRTGIWESYQQHRSKLIEQYAERLFAAALQPDAHWHNLNFDIPGVATALEADVLLRVDQTLVVVEAKAGDFSAAGRNGQRGPLVDDLRGLVGKATKQAARLARAVRGGTPIHFYDRTTGATVAVDLRGVERVEPVLVSLRSLGWLQPSHDLLVEAGIVQEPAEDIPWLVDVFELGLIAQTVDHPSQLTRFLAQRRQLTPMLQAGTELNLWLMYLRYTLARLPRHGPASTGNFAEPLDRHMMFPNAPRPRMVLAAGTVEKLRRLERDRPSGWLGRGEQLIAQEQRGREPGAEPVHELAAQAVADLASSEPHGS